MVTIAIVLGLGLAIIGTISNKPA